MKFSFLKWLFLAVVIVTLFCVNERYKVFALTIPKGRDNVGKCLRVMTYNVNTTSSMKDLNGFKKGLIEEIERHNPDVLCLQELVPVIFKQVQTSMDSLFGYSDSMKIKKDPMRYALYSKFPIRGFTRYKSSVEIDTMGFDSKTKSEVDHVADLARLHVDESEYELYERQLYDILSEVKKIEDIDVEGETEMMISPSTNVNAYSNDTIGPMLSKEEILKNVKHTNGDFIVVPTVIND